MKKLLFILTSLIVLLCSISLPVNAELLSKPIINPNLNGLIENAGDSSGEISINASPFIEKKDLGFGAGAMSIMTRTQTRAFTSKHGYNEHTFKQSILGKKYPIAQVDISYHKKTRAVYLVTKDGNRFAPTGYYHMR